MKKIIISLFAMVFSLNLMAQKNDLYDIMKSRNEYYFSFELNDVESLEKISRIISIDKIENDNVIAYANEKQYNTLLSLGVKTELLTPPSMMQIHEMYDGTTRAEYEWDEYPTYEAYEAMMQEFASTYSDKCSLIELGTLASGRKILLVRINNGITDGKPKFLYGSTIHGDETTGYVMMLRLIDLLLTRPDLPEVANVLENIDLFICPNANPDGTYKGGNHTVHGATRSNAFGVDMNRNYPDPIDGPHPDGEDYAIETEWFMQFAEDYQFTMAAHYHGGAEVMNYPWDNNYQLHADDNWWRYVSYEYASMVQEVDGDYMNEVYDNPSTPGVTNGAQWYTIGGGRQDYMNYYQQCREVTIECSYDKTPYESQLPHFWDCNYNSIFAYMNQCLYGIHGTVIDSETKEPLNATIEILNHDEDYSMVETQLPMGDFHRPIKAGTYTVEIKSNGYYPAQHTVTVVDGEKVTLNVELEAAEGLVADFSADATDVPLYAEVQFTDETWGANVVSWCWQFEGAEPSTSSIQNPLVRYNEVGQFNVSLTVTNADGDRETIEKRNYITVSESYNMSNTTVTTSNALFYDSGGANNNYSDSESITMIFMPAIEGGAIQVEFVEFSLEDSYDKLRIYDGTSTSATCLADLSGSSLPGVYSAENSNGALTFHFTSDYMVNNPGWKAIIKCIGGDLTVTAEASQDTICLGETVNLYAEVLGGSGEYTYSWQPEELLDNNAIPNPVALPNESGDILFTLTVSDGQNVVEKQVLVVVKDCENIDEQYGDNITIYPNPAKDVINVILDKSMKYVNCTLLNVNGQIVKNSQVNGNVINIDLDNVNKGLYFLNITIEGKQIVRKVVVE